MSPDRGRFGGVLAGAKVLAAAALMAGAATLLRASAPAAAQADQLGLSYYSVATWTVEPNVGAVHVDLEITATSNTVNSGGGRRYFFAGLPLTLPLSTDNYLAFDSKGQSLALSTTAAEPYGIVVYVPFRQRLYSGQTTSVDVQFDLVDLGGSTDRDLRIGQDIISFPVSAFGSQGTPGGTVTVVFPAGYVVQEQFGALTSAVSSGGGTVFSSGPVADATALNAWFAASRTTPAADFKTEELTVGQLAVTLRYWADDPGWATQVAHVLQVGYPVLSSMISLGDPASRTLTVEEATTQGIDGFSGDYDAADSLARVSYFADPLVILHETAHMWFNGALASDRWIDEGFASYYAEQAVLQAGLPDHPPGLSPALMQAAIPLNDWTSAGTPGTATEAYLYGASLEVARRIVAIAGMAGMSEVWLAARSGSAAYARSSDIPSGGAADWRSLLDYLERTTGKSYTSIWQQWVVTSSQASLLGERDSARAAYSAAETAAGGWLLGPDIRGALSRWQFGTATTLLNDVPSVMALRRQIEDESATDGTTPPASLQRIFETVGVSAALAEAQQEIAALSDISAAGQAKVDSEGAARAVGLLGTDPDADLAAARKAFAAGDIGKAASLAEAARSAWTGARTVGKIRILGAAAGLAGVLLLLALYIWTRSSRPRRNVPAGADGPAAADAGGAVDAAERDR
jgi:hypothetical protein